MANEEPSEKDRLREWLHSPWVVGTGSAIIAGIVVLALTLLVGSDDSDPPSVATPSTPGASKPKVNSVETAVAARPFWISPPDTYKPGPTAIQESVNPQVQSGDLVAYSPKELFAEGGEYYSDNAVYIVGRVAEVINRKPDGYLPAQEIRLEDPSSGYVGYVARRDYGGSTPSTGDIYYGFGYTVALGTARLLDGESVQAVYLVQPEASDDGTVFDDTSPGSANIQRIAKRFRDRSRP